MIVQGRDTPAHNPDKPRGGVGPDKPAHQKPGQNKPAHHKPVNPKPQAHRKPTRPAHHKPIQGKKTAPRGEADLIWFDVDYKPLAKGGHIH